MSKPPPMWAHQKKTYNKRRRHAGFFDLSDPGTGKTRPALAAWEKQGKKRLLVICVKSNIQAVWENEVRLWVPDASFSAAFASNRAAAFKRDADIVVTNTDATKWLAAQPKKFFSSFDSLIVDESSYFKHRTSQRSKALAKIRDHFEYIELMSGTPNATTILDIWHQAFIIDGGYRLGQNFYGFRNAACVPRIIETRAKQITTWEDRDGIEEAVYGLLHDIAIRHRFDECIDIPPNTIHFVEHKLPPKLLAQYRLLEDEARLALDRSEVIGINKVSLVGKLLQLASGAVYTEQGDYEVVDTARYELITDLIEERRHSVTFFNWRHQRDQLVKEFERRKLAYAVIDGATRDSLRAAYVQQFRAGKLRTLLMHPQTGAHGLTLTAGETCIWCSPIYAPDLFNQGIHRIHRGGQTKRTETLCVRAGETREAKVYNMLQGKERRMFNFLDLFTGADG